MNSTPPSPSSPERSLEEENAHLRARLELAERALAEFVQTQPEKFLETKALMDVLPTPVLISHDPRCERMTGNRAAFEFLRIPQGSNLSQSAPAGDRPNFTLWAQGKPLAPHELPAQRAAINGETVCGMEMEVRFADSTRAHILCYAHPVRNSEGEIQGSVVVFVDISARKKAEEAMSASELRFRSLFESAPIPVAITLPDGRLLEVNQAYLDMLGYKRDELEALTFMELTHPEDRTATTTDVVEAMMAGRIQHFRSEKRYLHKSGRVVWGDLSVSAVRNPDGTVAYFIAQVQDVTLRKEAEKKLREAVERKDRFLAILSHELRNPLAAMRYAVELEKEHRGDENALPWAKEVLERQVFNLSRMVNDLLDTQRIELGLVELRLKKIPLEPVVRSAFAAVSSIYQEKQQAICVEVAPDLVVEGDEVRLEQVFVNLLHNAVKFTPSRSKIWLDAKRQGEEVLITISDDGAGIPEEMLSRIFEPFLQVDRSLEHSDGGLGLGLAVVRTLVEMHRGHVEVRNHHPDPGVTFSVRLPRVAEPVVQPLPPPGPRVFSRRVRVLVVDDHVDNARGMARILELRNGEVRVAHDGNWGLTEAKAFLPELLILDIGLPGMDGYALATALHKVPQLSQSVFVAVSGYALGKDRERALAAGFDFHFAKPVDLDEVIARAAVMLGC